MFFSVAVVVLSFVFLCLLFKRIRVKMAAFIAWIVSSISGSKQQSEDQVEETSSDSDLAKNKGKQKGKGRQRVKKPNEPPTFHTNSNRPIEDIIEETLQEETVANPSTSKNQSKKEKPRKKSSKEDLLDHDNPEDLLEYSFFKKKAANFDYPKQEQPKNQSKQIPKKKPEKEPVVLNNSPPSEDTGFSVKEKGRKSRSEKTLLERQKSEDAIKAVIEQGINKKSDLSRPSIIEHYKKRARSGSPIKKETPQPIQPIHHSLSANRIDKEENTWRKSEVKESKKVISGISFANIVTNKIPDTPNAPETISNLEKAVSSSFVYIAPDSEHKDTSSNLPDITTNLENTSNLDKEDSSSIEVLSSHSELQYNLDDFQIVNDFEETAEVVDTADFVHKVIPTSNPTNGGILHQEFDKGIDIISSQNDYSQKVDIRFDSGENFDYIHNYLKNSYLENTKKLPNGNLTENFEIWNCNADVNLDNTVKEAPIDDFLQQEREDFVKKAFNGISNEPISLKEEQYNSADLGETAIEATEELLCKIDNQTSLEQESTAKSEDSEFVGNPITLKQESFVETEESEYLLAGNLQELLCESDNQITLEQENSAKTEDPEFVDSQITLEQEKTVEPEIVQTQDSQFNVVQAALDFITSEAIYSSEGNKTFESAVNEVSNEPKNLKEASVEDNNSFDLSETAVEAIAELIDQITFEQESFNKIEEPDIVQTQNLQEILCEIKPVTHKAPEIVTETNLETKLKELQDQIQSVNNILSPKENYTSESVELDLESQIVNSEIADLKSQIIYNTHAENKSADLTNGTTSLVPVEEPVCVKKSAYTTTDTEGHNPSAPLDSKKESLSFLEHQIISEVTTPFKTNIDLDNLVQQENIQASNCVKKELKPEEFIESSGQLECMEMTQIRVLTLNDKEHQESTIYRIEKNWVLQFRLGPSLLGRQIKLYCNYPKEGAEFERGTYQLLNWCQDEGCKNADDTALSAQIKAKISGSFHYYFVYENENTEERQGSGYFLVDPMLKFGNGEDLPLDSVQCQTVLSKHLGPFSTWENKLRVAKECGYNMVHFTPIQELGDSKSCYSLKSQLKLNSMFKEENGTEPKFADVEEFTQKMRTGWKILSICDIVLNHTANESQWIREHPEATYNCANCPYMKPAYLLDAAFHQFSLDVKKGLYEDRGIPPEISTEDHLNAIRYHFKAGVFGVLKLEELFIVDVPKTVAEFLSLARKSPPISENNKKTEELKIIQDPDFRRMASTIDLQLALTLYNVYRQDTFDEDARLKKCSEDLKNKLDSLNQAIVDELNGDLDAAVENVIAGIRYFRVQHDGPKVREITVQNPLVYRYFTDYGTPKSLNDYENIMYSVNGKYLMAHNGWVMNADPLKNFADPGSKVYIRRELIAWGDSVKLRYGNGPEDCPVLWDHMKQYVDQTAKIFDGVRLDNCHSTPIPVAEYLLDSARKIRPDLYVVAELFTQSDMLDNIFVNRLGITSLIREAMSAWDSHEEGRLVYRYGGVPVGSFYQPSVRPLVPMVAHALFLDLTHDNPSPVEKRSVFDLLPSTALVNMACCASGSNRGYDELVPHHIHVVDETRQYTEWTDDDNMAVGNSRYVTAKSGIIAAKKAINELHCKLGKEGFNQVYVDQMDPDVVAVTRHNPVTHQSYVLVAYTAFGHPDENADNHQKYIRPLKVEGVLQEVVLEASLSHVGVKSGGSKFTKFDKFIKDPTWINGLSDYTVNFKQHIQVHQSDIFEEANSGTKNVIQLNFKNFKPGSVVIIKVALPSDMKENIDKVRNLINSFSVAKETELKQIVYRMTLADLNRTLYRCDQEERDEGHGFDAYNIPNFGSTVYCGLQGFISLLSNIRPNNDLGHPMCANLRDGNWMIDYIWKRLKVDEGTKELGQWIEENTKHLQNIPRYLIPCYFDVIVTGLYVILLEQSYNLMSDFVKNGSTFVRGLALGSLQFAAYIKSADLPVLSPNLDPPKPPTRKNQNGELVQACVTLSAGLPHFSIGYMRNWGRDTFISLRGLLILTGRYEEARQHILGYAACLRHGLIPNLLDGGRNSRFNCRDAVWWWLYCIKCYCEEAPNGLDILQDKVSRLFPTDEAPAQPAGSVDQPLFDVIQEALKIHFQGLKFRERNAGRHIDEHMVDAGFNNQIGIHPETGFVFGGNQWNCGTWMDKMGSSDKAGNRGKPATPRDGSAVELVGLSKAVVSWLWRLNQEGKYPYKGVERTHKNSATTKWTFKEWAAKIQESFEKKFFVKKGSPDEENPDLVNKSDIYKDSYNASEKWADYQLRCNFPIAMVAAPELFNPQKAWAALKQAEEYLLGPLGMKTLDSEDWNYRGDYDNSNDSNDFHTAHGFNYHQGPEWVWPIGYFLRAKLIFAAQNGVLNETIAATKVILSKHFTELQTSPWRGLPELTNSNGSYCHDSSRTQAWSMGCVLEVLHDLQKIEAKQIVVN